MKKKILLAIALMGTLLVGCTKPTPSNSTNPSSSASGQTTSETSNSSFSTSTSDSSKDSSKSSSNPSSSEGSSSSTSVEQRVPINIINQSTRYCTINSLTAQGYPGDDAEFTITMKEDYNFKSVSASDNSGKNVELLNNEGTYLFEIPNDGTLYVTVEAEKIVKTQKLYVTDPKGILTANPAYVTVSGVTPITDIVVGEGETYYRVVVGNKIRFFFPNKINYQTLYLTFNNRNYQPNANNVVDIDMSPYAGDLRVEVFGKKLGSPLVANNSEHLTITFMDVNKSEIIDAVVTNTDYYVIITSADKNIYVLDSLKLTYTTKGSSSPTTYDLTDYVTETATGYELLRTSAYTATDDNGYIFTVEEDNLNKYVNEPFCGEYVAFTTFTYTATDYSDLSLDLFKIIGSGKATYKNRSMKIRDFNIDENNIYNLKNKDQYYTEVMYYQDDCLIAGYNGSNDNFGTPFYTSATDSLSDDLYAIKMLPNTQVSDYSIDAQAFTISGVTYVLGVVNYQNSFYKAICTRRDKARHVKDFYSSVTIDVMYGNSWKDEKSIFSIKKGETVIATIGFNGNGGNKHKTLLPDYGGLFTNGNDQLVVCEGMSIYKGTIYVSSLADNQTTLTLINSNSTVVIELDAATRTYSVSSSNEKTMTKGPFAGKKYRVNHTNGFDANNGEGNYGYYIEFDANEAKLNCVADIFWNMTMKSLSQYAFGKTINADYYFDSANNTITAMILGLNDVYVVVQFEYRDGSIVLIPDALSGGKGLLTTNEIILNEVEA